MDFDEYLAEELSKDDELRKEYEALQAKQIKLICPNCGKPNFYRNWFEWVLHTPFHGFGKRKTKCPWCGKSSWVKRIKE